MPRFWRFKFTNFNVVFWVLWLRKIRVLFSWRQSYLLVYSYFVTSYTCSIRGVVLENLILVIPLFRAAVTCNMTNKYYSFAFDIVDTMFFSIFILPLFFHIWIILTVYMYAECWTNAVDKITSAFTLPRYNAFFLKCVKLKGKSLFPMTTVINLCCLYVISTLH